MNLARFRANVDFSACAHWASADPPKLILAEAEGKAAPEILGFAGACIRKFLANVHEGLRGAEGGQ